MSALDRGENCRILAENPGLRTLGVGVRWDAGVDTVLDRDLSLAVVLCGADGKVADDGRFVYMNQIVSSDRSTEYRTPDQGSPLKEVVEVDLADVPADVQQVAVVLFSHGAGGSRGFDRLRSCSVVFFDAETGKSLLSSVDLVPALKSITAATLASVYRYRGEWKVKVVGDGFSGGLQALAKNYGVGL